ncbi:hypothetical protein IFR05_010372 [Cadophora sp. M221]|nr:hypothetical protein IFR05_010372 [Cadophora sp. M221]
MGTICASCFLWQVNLLTRGFLSLPETKEERIEMARQYGRQLAHAVAFLHSVGIVHGDLTQRNILTQTSGLQIDSLDELYERIGEPSRIFADRWGSGCRFKYLVRPADLSEL